jgi:cysteinyl-tRNA synthetase
MMDHTPIEALFHHKPNCTCDTCTRVIKPFRSGTFVSSEDIEKMNKSIQELIQENSRLQGQLNQANEHKAALEQYANQLAKALQENMTQQSAVKAEEQKTEDSDGESDSDDEEDETDEQEEKVITKSSKKDNQKNIVITIDTSKLIYIAIIVVIAIMVLKR